MIEFVVNLGWKFVGNCNCSDARKIYINENYPKWQVHISMNQDVFQMRRVYDNPQDTKIKGQGGKFNYQNIYNFWISQQIA